MNTEVYLELLRDAHLAAIRRGATLTGGARLGLGKHIDDDMQFNTQTGRQDISGTYSVPSESRELNVFADAALAEMKVGLTRQDLVDVLVNQFNVPRSNLVYAWDIPTYAVMRDGQRQPELEPEFFTGNPLDPASTGPMQSSAYRPNNRWAGRQGKDVSGATRPTFDAATGVSGSVAQHPDATGPVYEHTNPFTANSATGWGIEAGLGALLGPTSLAAMGAGGRRLIGAITRNFDIPPRLLAPFRNISTKPDQWKVLEGGGEPTPLRPFDQDSGPQRSPTEGGVTFDMPTEPEDMLRQVDFVAPSKADNDELWHGIDKKRAEIPPDGPPGTPEAYLDEIRSDPESFYGTRGLTQAQIDGGMRTSSADLDQMSWEQMFDLMRNASDPVYGHIEDEFMRRYNFLYGLKDQFADHPQLDDFLRVFPEMTYPPETFGDMIAFAADPDLGTFGSDQADFITKIARDIDEWWGEFRGGLVDGPPGTPTGGAGGRTWDDATPQELDEAFGTPEPGGYDIDGNPLWEMEAPGELGPPEEVPSGRDLNIWQDGHPLDRNPGPDQRRPLPDAFSLEEQNEIWREEIDRINWDGVLQGSPVEDYGSLFDELIRDQRKVALRNLGSGISIGGAAAVTAGTVFPEQVEKVVSGLASFNDGWWSWIKEFPEHLDWVVRTTGATVDGMEQGTRSTGSPVLDGLSDGFREEAGSWMGSMGGGVVPVVGRQDASVLKGLSKDLSEQGHNGQAMFPNDIRREIENGDAMIVGYRSDADYERAVAESGEYGIEVDRHFWRKPNRKNIRPAEGQPWTSEHLKKLATTNYFYPDAGLRRGPR